MIRATPALVILFFVSMSTALRAQGPPAASSALTLDQAIREALDRNLTLKAERDNLPVADAAVRTASLRPNPVMTLNLMHPDRALVDAGVSPDEQVMRIDYVVERGGKRERRIDQADLAKSVAAFQLLNTTRTLVVDVENAFTDVQLAKLNVELAQSNLAAFNDVVRVNTERVRTGDLSRVELSRSHLAALQFQNDVRQQEMQLRVAKSRLSTLLGRGAEADAVDVTGDLRADSEAVEYPTLLRRALEARPDLQAARTDQARSTADLRLQLANGKIDYTISGEYHRQESDQVHGNSYGLFVSAPLAIFNRNQGEIARADIQRRQLDTRIQALESEIASEVTTAYAEYTVARQIVDNIEHEMLTEARDVRTATEYSYRRGEASFVEFLDAVRAFNDTMQSYNAARASYARSLYALDSTSGKGNP